MTTEIELKYLVLGDNTQDKISEIFNRENIQFSYQQKQLSNCYFDTPDLNLRQHDMGLRVRCNKDHIEQTIKTAGQVVGGLHSRPEYNVDIKSTCPVLELFPKEIWQAEQVVSQIQNDLITLFSTNFTRSTWMITDAENNVIELAYDRGEIISSEQNEVIDEIELELVQGETSALFRLSALLFDSLALRPGLKSKAARGYALWGNKSNNENKQQREQQHFICHQRSDTIADAFTYGLSYGLTRLQMSIEEYLSIEGLQELAEIKANLALIRHGFWLFDEYLTAPELEIRAELSHFIHLLAWVDNAIHLQELTNKTGNYRKKLDFSKQLIKQLKIEKRRFPNVEEISQLLHSSRFNQLQLSILQLYLTRTHYSASQLENHKSTLVPFAQEKIQLSLSEMSIEMKNTDSLNCQQYIAQSKRLYRSSLTGTWLAGLFDHELRDKFRRPWLDIQQGISELQSLWIIHQQLDKLDEAPKKLVEWQQRKMEGLLLALNNSKAIAVSMTPYWYEST